MISGIGIDIIEIDRIKAAVKAHGKRFLNRIFTERELEYCRNRRAYRFPELAARFAAKEAYSKAIGTGMVGINHREIEVMNDRSGKPRLFIRGKADRKTHISLSHSLNYAVASVIAE
ncbi:MAG TPA: holo-ACP synthase [Candidatus Omnitrophota bacterium]|nr:holo-ACP synthase [Candidatus Omnitrophota bacterium]